MTTYEKIEFITEIIKNHLHSQDRKLLMILLMREDEYDVDDILAIIDDVLPADDFPVLASMLKST